MHERIGAWPARFESENGHQERQLIGGVVRLQTARAVSKGVEEGLEVAQDAVASNVCTPLRDQGTHRKRAADAMRNDTAGGARDR